MMILSERLSGLIAFIRYLNDKAIPDTHIIRSIFSAIHEGKKLLKINRII
jgi:hypothetical protein